MAFTDNCDLFASVHENGVNRAIQHIMRQRPSLFNYATADVAGNRELWCQIPEFTADVTTFGNPMFTILPYLPVIGADSPPVGIGFCLQVARAQVDFHPSNITKLPPELGKELQAQRFALELKICGGVRCPDPEILNGIPVVAQGSPNVSFFQGPLAQVQVRGRMLCFCLEVFVVGDVAREFITGQDKLVGRVDGVEIVDVKPGPWPGACRRAAA
jgi:hypothetical protein